MRKLVGGFSVLAFAGLAACASGGSVAQQGKTGKSCELRKEDAPMVMDAPLYRDCAVDTKAKLESSTTLDYRPSDMSASCYSAEVAFVVDANGRPEPKTVRVVRTTSGDFGEALARSVVAWRYKAATIDGQAVRQIVQEKQGISVVRVIVPAGQVPSRGSLPRAQKC